VTTGAGLRGTWILEPGRYTTSEPPTFATRSGITPLPLVRADWRGISLTATSRNGRPVVASIRVRSTPRLMMRLSDPAV
jgi:hypothetical protein